jgi:hypothetical protein
MMPKSLDVAIHESLRLVPLSTGDNLLGFEIDLVQGLQRSGQFTGVTIKRSNQPSCKLVAACATVNSDTASVTTSLQRIWKEQLCYEHFEAHDVQQTSSSVILRFVTRSGDQAGDLCVTGKIIASGSFAP